MQNIVLAYYIDDILLIRPEVQEVVSVSPLDETYALLRVGDKKPTKIQRLTRFIKFLEVQWSGVCCGIPFKVKDNFLNTAPLAMEKEPQHLVDLFGF